MSAPSFAKATEGSALRSSEGAKESADLPPDITWPRRAAAFSRAKAGRLELSRRVQIMGIVNVTPDSFSDGGKYPDVDAAIEAGLRMLGEGADIIDIGGESTRPGSAAVPPEEEKRRVVPVIEGIRAKSDAVVSVDTRKAEVARAALAAGADIVNDVSALRDDPALAALVAYAECPVILMHMKGTPRDMQRDPHYDGPGGLMGEVRAFFEDALARAEKAGVDRSRTIIDPGIGFGKTVEHNLTLVKRLGEFAGVGRPILVGASRKSFIGKTLGIEDATDRLEGTLAVTTLAVARGARIIRVHDVKENVRAVRMAEAVLAG